MGLNDSYAVSAEASVIGSVLISPEIVGNLMLKVKADDFEDFDLRRIFIAIKEVWQSGQDIDPVVVCGKAGEDSQQIIKHCMVQTPTAASWEMYADIVSKNARLRKMKASAAAILSANSLDEVDAPISVINKQMTAATTAKITSFADGIQELYFNLMEKKKPDYLQFGFAPLDCRTYIEKGDFVIIAGYPSSGKTMLASQFAAKICSNHRVGIFSLETSASKLYARIAAQQAKIPFSDVKHSSLEVEHFQAMMKLLSRIEEQQLTLDVIQASGMSVADIRAISLANRYDVIFIDYLQIIDGAGAPGSYERVTATSIDLHIFAQSTGTTVIALSQLKRPESGSNRRKPTMSDLRASGQIEQDADLIMALAHTDDENRNGGRDLHVLKNKEGDCGMVELIFDNEHLSLLPYSKRDDRPRNYSIRDKQKAREEAENR